MFLERFCESLEVHENDKLITELCNYNIADALKALTEIVSNKHFIDYDRIIGDFAIEDQKPEIGLSSASVLRVFAYGNTAEPIYPVRNTRIPNIISGDKWRFPRTFVKPRMLQMLIECHDHSHAVSSKYCCDTAQAIFNRPVEQCMILLDELYSQKLVDTTRGYAPSKYPLDCELYVTPRALRLWRELSDDDVLIGLYRDDLHLSESNLHRTVATFNLTLTARCVEMVEMLIDCINGETRELIQMHERQVLGDFKSVFNATMISANLYDTIHGSVYSFYSKYMKMQEQAAVFGRLTEARTMLERGCELLRG